jgi:dTDP-4-dehydrorhamnose reductase
LYEYLQIGEVELKILIFGGSGMLGHRLWIELSKEHDTYVTIRKSRNIFPDREIFPEDKIRFNVEANYIEDITRAVASIQPDLVINCIGLIKQMGHLARDPLLAISINSLLPHRLSMICRVANIRMIHISTDCVFSGKKGVYAETDDSDAIDLYGRTKYLGEVYYPHCVTLRTSIIGRELKSNLGLIEWFLAQKGSINGYKNAIYTGVTTHELSRVISDYIIPNKNISGLYQVSSEPISKFDLLQLTKQAFNKDIEILPETDFKCDRSLDSTKFRNAVNYKPKSWKYMIEEMAETQQIYNGLEKK